MGLLRSLRAWILPFHLSLSNDGTSVKICICSGWFERGERILVHTTEWVEATTDFALVEQIAKMAPTTEPWVIRQMLREAQ